MPGEDPSSSGGFFLPEVLSRVNALNTIRPDQAQAQLQRSLPDTGASGVHVSRIVSGYAPEKAADTRHDERKDRRGPRERNLLPDLRRPCLRTGQNPQPGRLPPGTGRGAAGRASARRRMTRKAWKGGRKDRPGGNRPPSGPGSFYAATRECSAALPLLPEEVRWGRPSGRGKPGTGADFGFPCDCFLKKRYEKRLLTANININRISIV